MLEQMPYFCIKHLRLISKLPKKGKIIKSHTPEDISAFARNLLATGHMLEIVMTPE